MAFNSVLEGLKLTISEDSSHIVLRSSNTSKIESCEFSFGIEEEYFLADAITLDVRQSTPNEFFEAVSWSTGGQAMREMLQAQLEVATNVHVDVADAREELKFLRREASRVAAQFGLAIMACGTHPTAYWRHSKLSPKRRYEEMIEDLQIVGARNMLCGMHVHVQLPDPAKRFALMCAMIPYLPLFIALSTSSPYWSGRDTGLKGYRLAAYDELPRTGFPELFESEEKYGAYIRALTSSGVMPDESHVWWAIRPSMRHPTLELRAPDSCTYLEDAVALASLYRSLIRHLFNNAQKLSNVTTLDRAIAIENKWRAQRYGVQCVFASSKGPIPLADYVFDLLELLRSDAEALGCARELNHCAEIIKRGTSADMQLRAVEAGEFPAAKRFIADTTVELLQIPDARSAMDAF